MHSASGYGRRTWYASARDRRPPDAPLHGASACRLRRCRLIAHAQQPRATRVADVLREEGRERLQLRDRQLTAIQGAAQLDRKRRILPLRRENADDQQAALANRERGVLPQHPEERLQHVVDEGRGPGGGQSPKIAAVDLVEFHLALAAVVLIHSRPLSCPG